MIDFMAMIDIDIDIMATINTTAAAVNNTNNNNNNNNNNNGGEAGEAAECTSSSGAGNNNNNCNNNNNSNMGRSFGNIEEMVLNLIEWFYHTFSKWAFNSLCSLENF